MSNSGLAATLRDGALKLDSDPGISHYCFQLRLCTGLCSGMAVSWDYAVVWLYHIVPSLLGALRWPVLEVRVCVLPRRLRG